MGKRRKSMASRLDECDRSMYATFCTAANSLSQLYTHAMNQQKLSFQAGERHALEKLYQWILKQHEEGIRTTSSDIFAHLQNELDNGEDLPISLRAQQHYHSDPVPTHFTNISNQTSCNIFGQTTDEPIRRSGNMDQTKNPVFTNALSSPIRRGLWPYQLAQECSFGPDSILSTANRSHISSSQRHNNSASSNDSAMDAQPSL